MPTSSSGLLARPLRLRYEMRSPRRSPRTSGLGDHATGRQRDELTTQLLRDVRGRAKLRQRATPTNLRELLALTFSDEIIRALHDTPGLTRLALLENSDADLAREWLARWVAVGLETAEAISSLTIHQSARLRRTCFQMRHRPLSILVGDVGAGKSVVAERAVQLALLEARNVPVRQSRVFLHMRDASGGLEAAIGMRAEGLGDPRLQGAVRGRRRRRRGRTPDVAARVIEEARELTQGLPQTRILITSRPTAALRRGVPDASSCRR